MRHNPIARAFRRRAAALSPPRPQLLDPPRRTEAPPLLWRLGCARSMKHNYTTPCFFRSLPQAALSAVVRAFVV